LWIQEHTLNITCYIKYSVTIGSRTKWQLTHKTCNILHEKLQTHIVGYYNVSKYKLESDILKRKHVIFAMKDLDHNNGHVTCTHIEF
jgi:hypothetical protein